MENHSGLIKGNKCSLLSRGVLLGAVCAGMLLYGLLAGSLGRANAQPNADPTAAAGVPNCGAPPFCADILSRSPQGSGFDCWYQPICSKLQARKYGITSLSNNSLPAVILSQPQPGAYDIQIQVTEATRVRSGPGVDFHSYGELPKDLVSRVIGVSRLGNWWVIPLPLTIAPDGMGWVDAASVSVSNVSTAQMDPPACRGSASCGMIQARSQPDRQFSGIDCSQQPVCSVLQAHNRQKLRMLLPSFTVERLLGQ